MASKSGLGSEAASVAAPGRQTITDLPMRSGRRRGAGRRRALDAGAGGILAARVLAGPRGASDRPGASSRSSFPPFRLNDWPELGVRGKSRRRRAARAMRRLLSGPRFACRLSSDSGRGAGAEKRAAERHRFALPSAIFPFSSALFGIVLGAPAHVAKNRRAIARRRPSPRRPSIQRKFLKAAFEAPNCAAPGVRNMAAGPAPAPRFDGVFGQRRNLHASCKPFPLPPPPPPKKKKEGAGAARHRPDARTGARNRGKNRWERSPIPARPGPQRRLRLQFWSS